MNKNMLIGAIIGSVSNLCAVTVHINSDKKDIKDTTTKKFATGMSARA